MSDTNIRGLEEGGAASVGYAVTRDDFTVAAEAPLPILPSPLMASSYEEWADSVGDAASPTPSPVAGAAARPEIKALRLRTWESAMMADPDHDGLVNLLE